MSQASSSSSLHLTEDASRESEALFIERRTSPRRVVSGRVTALLRPPGDADAAGRICSLQLHDLSDTGLGVFSQDAMPVGSILTAFFPPHGPERGFDLVGQVSRCVRREQGYEVGVRLDRRMAA